MGLESCSSNFTSFFSSFLNLREGKHEGACGRPCEAPGHHSGGPLAQNEGGGARMGPWWGRLSLGSSAGTQCTWRTWWENVALTVHKWKLRKRPSFSLTRSKTLKKPPIVLPILWARVILLMTVTVGVVSLYGTDWRPLCPADERRWKFHRNW